MNEGNGKKLEGVSACRCTSAKMPAKVVREIEKKGDFLRGDVHISMICTRIYETKPARSGAFQLSSTSKNMGSLKKPEVISTASQESGG